MEISKFYTSEFIKLKSQKAFIMIASLYVIGLIFLLFQVSETNVKDIYRIFNAITFFIITSWHILSFGEIIEKGIIRYYLEYLPNRTAFLMWIYIEYSLVYLLLSVSFVILTGGQLFNHFFVYLMIFLLYITINTVLIINIGRSAMTILLSIILLWVLPNLVNYIFSGMIVYDFQLFYYLSSDSFTQFHSVKEIVIPLIYVIIFYSLSMYQFKRKEY